MCYVILVLVNKHYAILLPRHCHSLSTVLECLKNTSSLCLLDTQRRNQFIFLLLVRPSVMIYIMVFSYNVMCIHFLTKYILMTCSGTCTGPLNSRKLWNQKIVCSIIIFVLQILTWKQSIFLTRCWNTQKWNGGDAPKSLWQYLEWRINTSSARFGEDPKRNPKSWYYRKNEIMAVPMI